MQIRPTLSKDISDLGTVLEGTGLFPPEMLPTMVEPYLSGGTSEDLWLTCEDGGTAIGFCYAAPEQLADGTWNMLAVAVLPARQSEGVGAALVDELETILCGGGQRLLIADTSGTDVYRRTRAFYRKDGYTEEARIRDFWAPGDDKVTFWKRLESRSL